MIRNIYLDHVAIAIERHSDALGLFGGYLSGRWVSGGFGLGFAPGQLEYANKMRIELLQPNRVQENDFLRRFLDHHGPGPHHLTYKVADLQESLDEIEAAGLRPVNVDTSDPFWKEAFVHPKEALGVLIQLAQPAGPDWTSPPPREMPAPMSKRPAILLHVAHAVSSIDEGLALFCGLLGGIESARGHGEDSKWAEVTWPGPGRVRLLQPTSPKSPLSSWLSGKPGRVHHVAFACENPRSIPGAQPTDDSTWTLQPERKIGTRVVLTTANLSSASDR